MSLFPYRALLLIPSPAAGAAAARVSRRPHLRLALLLLLDGAPVLGAGGRASGSSSSSPIVVLLVVVVEVVPHGPVGRQRLTGTAEATTGLERDALKFLAQVKKVEQVVRHVDVEEERRRPKGNSKSGRTLRLFSSLFFFAYFVVIFVSFLSSTFVFFLPETSNRLHLFLLHFVFAPTGSAEMSYETRLVAYFLVVRRVNDS
jgi:hypothetical protein